MGKAGNIMVIWEEWRSNPQKDRKTTREKPYETFIKRLQKNKINVREKKGSI